MKILQKLAVVLALVALSGFAAAEQINFQGTTTGCFGASCVPGGTASTNGLSFTGSSWSATTDGGFAALGSNGDPLNASFGQVTLTTAPGSYNTPFTLVVTVTVPSTIGGSHTFSATVSGTATTNSSGGVTFNFTSPNSFTFSFDDGTHHGVAVLTINNFSVSHNSATVTQNISGTIVTTPEPGSLALLGTGLMLGGGVIRRKFLVR